MENQNEVESKKDQDNTAISDQMERQVMHSFTDTKGRKWTPCKSDINGAE